MDTALIWFRRDLRLADHAALFHALNAARRTRAVFVFDTDILDSLEDRTDRRVAFIWRGVAELKAALEARGGTLHVLHGSARREITALAARWGVDAVFAARDYEPFAGARDAAVAAVAATLAAQGRRLILVKDQVVFDTDEVLTGGGRPFQVFTPYKRAWLARLTPERYAAYAVEERLDRIQHEAPAPLPSLEALGFRAEALDTLRLIPGEAGARGLLGDFLGRMRGYRQQRDFPALKGPSYLSAHLRFGMVSIRELVRRALETGGAGGETWLSELIWREFYQMLLWHYPHTAEHAFQARFDAILWPDPPGHFEAWAEARTGYPIVDAAMRQLNTTGYMHNRLRMVAASFLVKDLHVDWRRGERYFARQLLDYDQAANVGGWQWSAGVGSDAQPWFRVFNPVRQSEKFDPDGRFIRRYLPELAAVPDRYVHAPWLLPAAAQAAGFSLGRDYPAPIVNHAAARAATLALFKAAAG
ncbi:MAG: deoxyribodipyrimidine photo-lyase [bacterium]|nr:MAG: deoxyribodipyrimidine photo-lyase [bacterium]KAF0149775.1 MAG: deoxyribodipyrimidine photo-lyase [bacterium]KAF0167177.1 MAG: deoxyribodipyrimidine photo-lyase [bacterium]